MFDTHSGSDGFVRTAPSSVEWSSQWESSPMKQSSPVGENSAGVLAIRVEGTAFLEHMVRNVVGTLMDVGRGLRKAEDAPGILGEES